MVNWTKWLSGRGREGRGECGLAERKEESKRSSVVLTQPLQSVFSLTLLKRETISLTIVTHSLHLDPCCLAQQCSGWGMGGVCGTG